MQILQSIRNLPLLPSPNQVELILSETLPPQHLVTSALALAFEGQSILMTNLNARGWDIPGGHLEAGESPEEALYREVMEETGARLSRVRPFGYQRISLLSPCPPNYRYPYPDSYQTFFLATVAELPEFDPTEETLERALFTPQEAVTLSWVQKNRPLFDAALAAIGNV